MDQICSCGCWDFERRHGRHAHYFSMNPEQTMCNSFFDLVESHQKGYTLLQQLSSIKPSDPGLHSLLMRINQVEAQLLDIQSFIEKEEGALQFLEAVNDCCRDQRDVLSHMQNHRPTHLPGSMARQDSGGTPGTNLL